MKKVLGIISLLLSATLATANSIDFDKAFKESTKIEKQIKKTSFPKQTYLITDFGAKPDTPDAPCHEAINQAIVTCCLNGGGTVVVPKRYILHRSHHTEKQRQLSCRRRSRIEIFNRSEPLLSRSYQIPVGKE